MVVRKTGLKLVVCSCIGILMLMPTGVIFNPIGEAEAAPQETALRIGFLGILSTLNPFIAYRENDLFFSSLVYDGLVSVDQDLNSSANLANSCYIVPDALPYGSVWQYNLTHNATWHDGEPMTAQDVSFTIGYQTGANYYAMWRNQPYTLWIDHSSVVDDYTVRVYFRNISGDPAPCAFGDSLSIPIVPKHIWQSISPSEAAFSFVNSFPIGTGPFMATASTYSEFIGGVNVTLLRNPNYHWTSDYGKQVHFDKIDLRYYADESALRDALQNGEIDVGKFNYTGYAQLESAIRTGSITNMTTMTGLRPDGYFTDLGVNMYGGGPNQARLDPFVRVALVMATDRAGLVDAVYGGNAIEGSTLVSPVYPYWHLTLAPDDVYPYNPLAALFLLELGDYSDINSDGILEAGPDSIAVQMGWVAEGTRLSFDLLVRYDRWEDKQIANALQEAYFEIGVEIVNVYVDDSTFDTIVYAYNYDLAINYWYQNPDPNSILFVESTYGMNGWSDNAYSSAEYDENYSASISEIDPANRQLPVQNCQLVNYADAPYIVFAYLNQTYVRRTDTFTGWGNWTDHPGRSLDARWGANPLFFDLIPNRAPLASFTVVPATGDTLTPFEFDASGSSDPEDAAVNLEVRWDWNNDGTWDTDWSTTKTAQHMFLTPDDYVVVLIVRDTGGLTNTTTEQVVVTEVVVPEFGMMPLVVMVFLATIFLMAGVRRRMAQ